MSVGAIRTVKSAVSRRRQARDCHNHGGNGDNAAPLQNSESTAVAGGAFFSWQALIRARYRRGGPCNQLISTTRPTIAAAIPISMALYQSNGPSMGAHYTRGSVCRLVSLQRRAYAAARRSRGSRLPLTSAPLPRVAFNGAATAYLTISPLSSMAITRFSSAGSDVHSCHAHGSPKNSRCRNDGWFSGGNVSCSVCFTPLSARSPSR